MLRGAYVEHRLKKMDENHLSKIGTNIASVFQTSVEIGEEMLEELIQDAIEEDLELDLLLAGIDGSGAHLALIGDPGTLDEFDGIGYLAIGPGERHADDYMMREIYKKSVLIKRALFSVFEAKKGSEIAAGVGEPTDICTITRDGIQIYSHTSSLVAAIEETYSLKKEKISAVVAEEVIPKIDAIKLQSGDTDVEE